MSRRSLILGSRRREAAAGMARQRLNEPAWRRVLRMSLVVVVFAVIGLGARWVLTTPLFAVSTVATGPYQFSDGQEVDGVLESVLGRNIWRCRTDVLASGLEALPWIEKARVQRRWPRSLQVQIQERRPVLVLPTTARSDAVQLLVEDGRWLPCPPDTPLLDLPELILTPPDSMTESVAANLVSLLGAVRTVGLEKWRTFDYIIRDERGFSFVLAGGATRLIVGDRDYVDRLRRYLQVAADLQPSAVIDLRFEGKISLSDPDAERRPTAVEGTPSWNADS